MADHMRKQIRDRVAEGLTGLPTTADRVYIGRTRPLAKAHDPTWLIYMRSETSQRAVRGMPPILERPCTLHIEGRTSTTTPPDDLLDAMAVEAEGAMWALTETKIGSLVLNVQMIGTEIIAEGGAEGERIIGGIRLEYRVTYRTVEGSPIASA